MVKYRVHQQDPWLHETQWFRAMRQKYGPDGLYQADRRQRRLYSIRIGDKVIQPSKETRFLGVTLDQNLSWRDHTKSLITKARRSTSLIKLPRGEA